MDNKEVNLNTINSGASVELFEQALKDVLANIANPNTKPEATREIKLVFKIKPDKKRSAAVTTVQVMTKLEPIQPHESVMLFGFDGDTVSAFTVDINQPELPLEEENVITMKEAK